MLRSSLVVMGMVPARARQRGFIVLEWCDDWMQRQKTQVVRCNRTLTQAGSRRLTFTPSIKELMRKHIIRSAWLALVVAGAPVVAQSPTVKIVRAADAFMATLNQAQRD